MASSGRNRGAVEHPDGAFIPALLSAAASPHSGQPAASATTTTQPAAASATPGLVGAATAELVSRVRQGSASAIEIAQYVDDVMSAGGISGLVDEMKSCEAESAACAIVHFMLDNTFSADKPESALQDLAECLEAALVSAVIDAIGRFRHCIDFPYIAFDLFSKMLLVSKVISLPAALEPSATSERVHTELATATDVCLSVITSQQSNNKLQANAFCFLSSLFARLDQARLDEKSHTVFGGLIDQYGCRAMNACLMALRTRAVLTAALSASVVLTLVVNSDAMAAYALETKAVPVLIDAASGLKRSNQSEALQTIALATAGIFQGAVCHKMDRALVSGLQDEAVSCGMIEVLISALHVDREKVSTLLPYLEMLCATKPACAIRAIKAGALELEAIDASADLIRFVNRLKAQANDAENSAAAAAAELLAAEDAERARAASKKPKRKKKPAATPSPAECGAAAGADDEPPADPAAASGTAFELSQSESALRRRRRAAAKAARRAAAVNRVHCGTQAAEESSDDEQSAVGGDAPLLPVSSAAAAPAMPAEEARSLEVAAAAPTPASAGDQPGSKLDDLFPWLSVADTASAPAAQRDAPTSTPLPPEHDARASPPHPPPPPSTSPAPVPFERFAAVSAQLARLQDELDATKCVICLSSPRCLAVLPCRHLPLCAAPECAAMMGAPPLCPLCRERVADTMQLFV